MNDSTRRAALEPGRKLIAEALVEFERGGDVEDIVDLIRGRVPAHEAGEWLLTARILVNDTVGVVEAWLDAPDLDDEVREALLEALTLLVPQGIGEELTPQRLIEYQRDIAGRPVSWQEVAVPLLFVIEVLTMNVDPDVEAMLLLE